MKRPFQKRNLRAAFTLVELIVVIGLMGMLATVSVAGYNAASNGMKNRAVVQDVTSVLRQAMQTAIIDNKTTAVLFYNRVLTKGSATGFAVVIREAGRLTAEPKTVDNLLVDEFADWHQSYPRVKPSSNDPGMRFYRMNNENELKNGRDNCSSLVHTYVTSTSKCEDYMITTRANVRDWVNVHRLTASENQKRTSSSYQYGNNYFWGLGFKNGDNLGWHAGDAYGTEIASLQLQEGYFFGSSLPTTEGDQVANPGAVVFRPGKMKTDGTISLTQSIKISKGDGKSWSSEITDQLLRDK